MGRSRNSGINQPKTGKIDKANAKNSKNLEKTVKVIKSQIVNEKPKQNTSGIQVKNRYESLNDDSDMSDTEVLSEPGNSRRRKPSVSLIDRKSYPPINITTELKDPKGLFSKIKTWAKNGAHFVAIRQKVQVYTYNIDDYKFVQQKLRESDIEFYTYTAKEDKSKKLVLKGIDKSFSENEVFDALKTHTEFVTKVSQFKSNKYDKRCQYTWFI
jgi:hypothetical protein